MWFDRESILNLLTTRRQSNHAAYRLSYRGPVPHTHTHTHTEIRTREKSPLIWCEVKYADLSFQKRFFLFLVTNFRESSDLSSYLIFLDAPSSRSIFGNDCTACYEFSFLDLALGHNYVFVFIVYHCTLSYCRILFVTKSYV